MSNVTIVTPYFSKCVRTAASKVVGCARWLLEETAEDKEAVRQLRRERLLERLKPRNTLTTVNLHLKDAASLVRSAESLGYKVKRDMARSEILLARATGERLAIAQSETGITVSTAGDLQRLQSIVRQHTVDRAVEHLKSRGMKMDLATRRNGDIEIRAHDAKAEIKTKVHTDGTVLVDVDKVQGSECVDMVSQLASAVGGKISDMKKKPSFFRLPLRRKARVRL